MEKSNKPETEGTETYMAQLIGVIDDIKGLESGSKFKVSIGLKNSGENKWPPNTKFVCFAGCFSMNSYKIHQVKPGDYLEILLSLIAPKVVGWYKTKWRLCYEVSGENRYFGPEVSFDINVGGAVEAEDDNLEEVDQNCTDDQKIKVRRLAETVGCTLQTALEIAKSYDDVGDVTLEELVQIYYMIYGPE
mmetsp:Transcript_66182/g.76830  ORF Transcript_66182/g.76830 Transcript_66182/m.76830 type:complete len:190 (+) Transcript_66182:69-638(+)